MGRIDGIRVAEHSGEVVFMSWDEVEILLDNAGMGGVLGAGLWCVYAAG